MQIFSVIGAPMVGQAGGTAAQQRAPAGCRSTLGTAVPRGVTAAVRGHSPSWQAPADPAINDALSMQST